MKQKRVARSQHRLAVNLAVQDYDRIRASDTMQKNVCRFFAERGNTDSRYVPTQHTILEKIYD